MLFSKNWRRVDWEVFEPFGVNPQYSLDGPDPFAAEVSIFLFLKQINSLSSMREDR